MLSPVPGAIIPMTGILSFGFQRTATHVHRGIDLPASKGTPVYAVAAGVVEHAYSSLASGFSGYGRVVVVRSGSDGPWQLYAHLDSVRVARGERVSKGQIIGTVGRTCFNREDPYRLCSGAHLHFEVSPTRYPQRSEAPRIDPVAWLQGAGEAVAGAAGGAGGALALVGLGALGWWWWRRGGGFSGLGVYKRARPFGRCNFVAYHGTYAKRADRIERTGLKPRGGEIWLTRSPKAAFVHTARRAAEEGCSNEPLAVLKVRVVGSADHCPVYRPVGMGPEAYMTTATIPPERVLERMPFDERAVAEGVARARRGKRIRKRRDHCPPKLGELLPGGRASGMRPSDFNPRQLRTGVRVEMEHTDDPRLAMEIAMDHLTEDPRYYDKLKRAGL